MMRTLKFTAFILFFNTVTSHSQTFSTIRLDSLFKALERTNNMGSVTISRGGSVVYSSAFGGYTSGKQLVKANTLTRYRIGSITKIFTAVMVLQLAQEHKLALNSPIGKYFPQVPNGGAISIDMLLSHRSGIHNFTADADYQTYFTRPANKAAMLARIARYKPDFRPGEKTVSSNTNYLLLGYLIEQVTGSSYAAQLKQRITAKIGLQHTYVGKGVTPAAGEAPSFNFTGSGWQNVALTDAGVTGGSGALISTPADMAQFIRAVFKLKLGSQASLTAMTPVSGSVGRGLIQVPVADMIAFGHFANIDGFKSTLLYLPQADVALAICFNSANTNDDAVVDKTLSIVLQQLSRKVSVTSAQLSVCTGVYTSKQLPIKITIRSGGDHLTMQAGAKEILPLETITANRYRFTKGDMTFDFDGLNNGKAKHFSLKQAGKGYDFFRE